MLQQLTIKTHHKAALRPILRSALDGQKKMVSFGLQKTRQRLDEFERQFGMSSEEFERRLNAGELDETVAFTDWRMELGMARLLEEQYQALQEAEIG
jgi:hypothetical protein